MGPDLHEWFDEYWGEWRVKKRELLDSSSLVKAVFRSVSSTESACARIASRMGSAICSEVASLEFSSESAKRSAAPMEGDEYDRASSFRQTVVHDQIIRLLEVQSNTIAGKIFSRDISLVLRRDMSEDIGQLWRERG